MKLNQVKSHDVEYIGDIQENRVGIDKSNLDFIATLLTSNLYSKPLESFLRETVANAYDSHIEAGTEEPILLLIEDAGQQKIYNYESSKKYRISIRDYGVGVSPERFDKIYKNIGSSTKRESNDFIGMFGIGRFSCLSLSDVATINSYYNGKKYSYMMYKNGGGINIDKVSEVQGDYKNGLEVSVEKDINSPYDINEAIKKLALFDKLHVTYKGTNYTIKREVEEFNNRRIFKFKYFSICNLVGYGHRNFFKVGSVIYECNSYTNLNTSRLIIDLPIGEVDITPNREALQYTDYTNNTIEKQIKLVKEELQEEINSSLNGNYTLSSFFSRYIIGTSVTLIKHDVDLLVSKNDVKLNYKDVKINGEHMPEEYSRFLNTVKYIGIPKELIYKQINLDGDRWYIQQDLTHVFNGTFNLAIKEDTVTKQVTLMHFKENLTKPTVILNYEGLKDLTITIMDYYHSAGVKDKDAWVKKCIEFTLKHLTISHLANDKVPKSFIDQYKLNRNSKKKEIPKTTLVRDYGSYGYRQLALSYAIRDTKDNGLILYTSNTREDNILKDLASLAAYSDGISRVITLKKEDLHLLENNRKFMTVESFMLKRNKLFSKLVTAQLIRHNLQESFQGIDVVTFESLPVYREFKKKYSSELRTLGYAGLPEGIAAQYISNGWINRYDITYFSITKEEVDCLRDWGLLLTEKYNVIKMMLFKKYGRLPRIGLTPVKVPKI